MEPEQRTNFILETLAMKGVYSDRPTERAIVDQDSLEDCVSRIQSLLEADDDESETR